MIELLIYGIIRLHYRVWFSADCIMDFGQEGVRRMNYIISGKNIDVTEGLRQSIYDKLGRLEKFFSDDTNIQVTFSVEKERQKIEVKIITNAR